MRNKLIATTAVLGLIALVLVAEAGPSGARPSPNLATVRVTKVVVGVAPPGTEFVVVVGDCRNREYVELTFPAEGGTMDAVINPGESNRDCTITETPPGGGCDTVTIEPPMVTLIGDTEATYPVTVTNICPEPEPEPEPEAAPAAAVAVPAAPTFTG